MVWVALYIIILIYPSFSNACKSALGFLSVCRHPENMANMRQSSMGIV